MNRYKLAAAAWCSVAAAFFLIHCQTTPNSSGALAVTEPPAVYDLKDGPLSVYDNHCSRCHGVNGSLYGASFYALDEHDLEYEVYDMMTGPAQLKPSTAEVEAMNRYHFAIQQKTPFACITNAESFYMNNAISLTGESTPNTMITLNKGQEEIAAVITKHKWTVQNPPQPPFMVQVSNSDHTLTYEFPAQQWSSVEKE